MGTKRREGVDGVIILTWLTKSLEFFDPLSVPKQLRPTRRPLPSTRISLINHREPVIVKDKVNETEFAPHTPSHKTGLQQVIFRHLTLN